MAGTIQRAQDAVLFEIQPAWPYPEDYLETVEQARRERERGYRPPLKSKVPEFERYQTIYLGFPIWGGTVPPVIRAFLATHDFKNRFIIPFITASATVWPFLLQTSRAGEYLTGVSSCRPTKSGRHSNKSPVGYGALIHLELNVIRSKLSRLDIRLQARHSASWAA